MELGERLLAVGAGERAASFDLFSETLEPAWIAQALTATGTASIRRRKLPAEYVVWLVIGMGCCAIARFAKSCAISTWCCRRARAERR
jgi:Insertion element 4 transposase N-terminal